MAIVKNTLLLRKVKTLHVRPDGSLHPEAYRPRERPSHPTGYEKNVSTALKTCFPTVDALVNFNFARTILYELNSDCPNSKGYFADNDHECHVGITGDMATLATDMAALAYLASESSRIYPPL